MGICFGFGGILCFWLLFRSYPPKSQAVLQIFQNAFTYINIIPISLSAYSQNYVRQPFGACALVVLIFFQWFTVGFGLSFFFRRMKAIYISKKRTTNG